MDIERRKSSRDGENKKLIGAYQKKHSQRYMALFFLNFRAFNFLEWVVGTQIVPNLHDRVMMPSTA